MHPGCREFQERLLARHVASLSHDDELATHIAACAACARFAERVNAVGGALGRLERKPVPAELPGRVVAACHAGHLQERAAKELSSLGRVEVPAELERKVLGDEERRLHAPFTLERLVDEELRDPSKALVRRFASRLPRFDAPEELFQRVHSSLGRMKPSVEHRVVWRITALATFFVVSGGLFTWFGLRETHAASALTFRVEHVQSGSELGPVASELFSGLTSGCSDLPRVAYGTSQRAPDERETRGQGQPR